MTPVIITFILFVATLLFWYSVNFMSQTCKKKREELFRELSREGSANNLIFCSQEVLQDKVIGIDGIHRKIMILEKTKNEYDCSIISLDEVQNCELIANPGSLNDHNLERFEKARALDAIGLQFQFNNQAQPASIIFYDGLINSKRELALLKAKAEYWCVMLSKMLNGQVGARA
ncbi:MAG: hypothetical protein Q8891_14920 [Bacteroidota bacterium]|nr:hypothetical protein [Bacteroidota bacterium]